MANEKLSVVRQIVEEGFGNADLYVIDQLMSENYIEHQFGLKSGQEGLKKAVIRGFFMGHEATGNVFSIDVMDVAKVEEGQISAHWGVPDRFALLTQLGCFQPVANAKP